MSTASENKTNISSGLYSTFRALGYDGATLSELSRATGLGKASLYHHFPGGKQEMAEELLRDAVAQLNKLAFKPLSKRKKPAEERIQRFLAGFAEYVSQGEEYCLAATLVLGGARSLFQDSIKQQTESWLSELSDAFSDSGLSDKKAHRKALELMTSLYGGLCLARMLNEPKAFQQTVSRLSKDVSKQSLT